MKRTIAMMMMMMMMACLGLATAEVSWVKMTPSVPETTSCVHTQCLEWSCAEWCKCYDTTKDKVYSAAGCADKDLNTGVDACDCTLVRRQKKLARRRPRIHSHVYALHKTIDANAAKIFKSGAAAVRRRRLKDALEKELMQDLASVDELLNTESKRLDDTAELLREMEVLFDGAVPSNYYSALLRDEVVRKDAFASPSPRFYDPKRFDISKCCTFDVFTWAVHAKDAVLDRSGGLPPGLQPDPGSPKDDIVAWSNDPAVAKWKATDRTSACLRFPTSVAWRWNSRSKSNLENRRDFWLRSISDWNNGRNWLLPDVHDYDPSNMWVTADGTPTSKSHSLTDSDFTKEFIAPGDSLVSFFFTDMAMLLKSSTQRGGIEPVCPSGGNGECLHGNADVAIGGRPHFDVSLPLMKSTNQKYASRLKYADPFAVAADPRPILAFFQGNLEGDGIARMAMYKAKIHDPENGFIVAGPVERALPSNGWNVKYNYDYDEMIKKTKFGLAPGGNGLHSFRLGEVMAAGCVPVDIQQFKRQMMLPFEDILDWSKFSFSIGAKEIPGLPALLRGVSDAQFRKMQMRSLAVANMFFKHKNWITIAMDVVRRNVEAAAKHSGKCGSIGMGH